MGVQLAKDAVDIGIVSRDYDASLRFYRDTLGFQYLGEAKTPAGSLIHLLMCGAAMVKLVQHDAIPQAANPPGGLETATGLRYLTISVTNLDEVVADCEAAGCAIAWPKQEIMPGATIAVVEDPDGNWVEILQLG